MISSKPHQARTVVVGGGTMGMDVAIVLARGGSQVTVVEPDAAKRQALIDLAFSCARIKAMTSGSVKPNCKAIASKGVSSCQAMAMMPDTSASDKEATRPE